MYIYHGSCRLPFHSYAGELLYDWDYVCFSMEMLQRSCVIGFASLSWDPGQSAGLILITVTIPPWGWIALHFAASCYIYIMYYDPLLGLHIIYSSSILFQHDLLSCRYCFYIITCLSIQYWCKHAMPIILSICQAVMFTTLWCYRWQPPWPLPRRRRLGSHRNK